MYYFQCYKIAKRDNNHNWKYFRIFDKHFGKKAILDHKYQSCKYQLLLLYSSNLVTTQIHK